MIRRTLCLLTLLVLTSFATLHAAPAQKPIRTGDDNITRIEIGVPKSK